MPGTALEFDALEAKLCHVFRNRDLLARALTHRSRAFEDNPTERFADNEQLEFLGDSILGFLVSERLVQEFPGYPEGRLSKLKAYLVSAAHLHEVAQDLGLGTYLLLGRSEEMSGGRAKKGILADAVEALIAAMYLDAGIEPVRHFVVDRIMADCAARDDPHPVIRDYKGALQELSRVKNLPMPVYRTLEEHGPQHARRFLVEVRVGPTSSRADGLSKKSAGQGAAHLLLDQLQASG